METRARLHASPPGIACASQPQGITGTAAALLQDNEVSGAWLSPALASAYRSGEVDARCRWLLAERTLDHYRRRQAIDKAQIGGGPWLSPSSSARPAALPLVSLDFCLTRPGLCRPRVAGACATTGRPRLVVHAGRTHPQERSASQRQHPHRPGRTGPAGVRSPRAHLMGAWDISHPDSAFDLACRPTMSICRTGWPCPSLKPPR